MGHQLLVTFQVQFLADEVERHIESRILFGLHPVNVHQRNMAVRTEEGWHWLLSFLSFQRHSY